MEYLKPNFRLSFLNFSFLCLLFIGSFSWSSLAFSYDEGYAEGYYWYYSDDNTMRANSPEGVRSLYSAGQPNYYLKVFTKTETNWQVKVYNYSGSALSGYKNIARSSCGSITADYCQPLLPENNCPEYGTVKRIATPINARIFTQLDGTRHIIPIAPEGPLVVTIGGEAVSDGCGYSIPVNNPEFPNFDRDLQLGCDTYEPPVCFQFLNYISTGEMVDASTVDVESSADDVVNNPDENLVSPEQLFESSTSVTSGTVNTTDPDGSSVQEETTVDSLVKNKGAVITDSTDSAVITVSDGIQKTVTTTLTTVTYPDGTSEVITDKRVSYTSTDKTHFHIDKTTGTVSVTNVPGTTASSKSTTTDTYDAQGNKTGTKIATSEGGDGEAAEQKSDDECEADPSLCKEWQPGGEGVGFDTAGITAQHEAEWAKIQTQFTDIKTEMEAMFSFSPSGTSLTCHDFFSYGGKTFDFCLSEYVEPLGMIGNALIFVVLLLAAGMIIGGRSS